MSLRLRAALLATLPLVVLVACDDDTTAPGPQPGYVKIVHAVSNAGPVSVTVDEGAPIATNVAPGAVSPTANFQYHGLTAGTRQVRVLTATGATAIEAALPVEVGRYYTVIAAGTVGGTGTLAPAFIVLPDSVLADTTNLPASGTIRLRAVHAALSVNGPVDVHAQLVTSAAALNLSAATRVFQSLAFRAAASAQVPAPTATTNYQICVIAAGTTPTANGSNCAVLAALPTASTANGLLNGTNRARAVVSAIARDPIGAEVGPRLLITTDKPVSP